MMLTPEQMQSASEDELKSIIDAAQKTIQERQKSRKGEVIAQIHELAASIGITVTIDKDKGGHANIGKSVQIKYRDPKHPENTWSGRGLTPKWLKSYLDNGHDKDEFLI